MSVFPAPSISVIPAAGNRADECGPRGGGARSSQLKPRRFERPARAQPLAGASGAGAAPGSDGGRRGGGPARGTRSPAVQERARGTSWSASSPRVPRSSEPGRRRRPAARVLRWKPSQWREVVVIFSGTRCGG